MLLGSLGALPPLSIDMALPALGEIGSSYGVSGAQAAWTLSLFMAGFAIAQLVFGPFSERYGRRPILLVGVTLFALAGFAAALAHSFALLLIARFVEGCGAGAGMAMNFAIIRDLFEGSKARTRLAYVGMVTNLAPMTAPALGSAMLTVAPWRAIYLTLGLAGLALLATIVLGLDESHMKKDPEALSPRRFIGGYARILATPAAIGNALIVAANFGCMFAYISGSADLMMRQLGLPAFAYSVTFAMTSGGILVGSYISSQFSRRHLPAMIPMTVGFSLSLAAALLLVALTLGNAVSVALFLPLFIIASMSFGLVAPNAIHGALHPLPQLAGVMGATIGFLQMAGASLASALVAHFGMSHGALAMTATMTVFSLTSAALYGLWVRPAERRKL